MTYCVNNINNREIERKFLVVGDSYKSSATSHARITQGYLSVNERATVRVRRYGEQAFLTVKGRPEAGHFGRFEWEKPITVDEAEQLFELCQPGIIDKTRWIVPMPDGLICEVDEFHGANEGLVLAEIELPSEDQPYVRLSFLGDEVTPDPRFYNSFLARFPYTTW